MKKLLLLLFIICFTTGLDMFVVEPNLLLVKTQKVYIPNWDKNLDGFKIGVISDLHVGTHFVNLNKLDMVVQKTNKQNPDLIVLLGDIDAKSVSDSNYDIDDIANVLKLFKAKYGVLSVMGNHDYEPANIVQPILNKSDIKLLEHQDFYIYPNGKKVRIVGFKDLWHSKSIPVNVIGTKNNNITTIVLAHNPDSFPEMPKFVSLTLSGHTHGGEAILPIIGSFIVPSEYGQRYRKGYIVENNKHLFVSGGIATTSRMRFLNPPEITILELYSQNTKIADTKPLKGINKNYAPIVIPKLRKLIGRT